MTTITIDRSVVEQALEALENGKRVRAGEGGTKFQIPLEDNAITALRATLAQQEEPTIDEYPLWSGMPPPEPRIHYEGPVTFHTQRCAVLPGQHAVLQMNTGVFHPSWAAQEQGWRLVRADTGLRKLALRLFGDA